MTRFVATSTYLCRTVLLLIPLLCLPLLAQASSIVPPRNLGELAFMSDAVVLARAGAGTAFGRSGMIFTATNFEVLETVQGAAAGRISVETYGGVLDGTGWQVAGTPTFEPDAVYLLFLDRNGNAWRPRMMAYGLLERVVTDDGTVMLTHIAEHHDLNLVARFDGVQPEPVETYYEQPLLNHLREMRSTRVTWNRQMAVVPEALQPLSHDLGASKSMAIPEPCVFLSYQGYPIRWNTSETSVPVNIFAQEDGDLDVGQASITAVQTSINLWKNISGVDVTYQWGGPDPYVADCTDGKATPIPGQEVDINQGLVQYNDPCDEITDLSGCTGTLAFGGSFFGTGEAGRHEHQGMEWNTSGFAFIVVNNGVGTCLSESQYRIMITHELGHTLGFGHIPTTAGDANMNPTCCNDITPIDETCALFAYSDQTVGEQLGAVALNTPADNATNQPTTLTLDWDTLTGADEYHLQVSESATFTNPLVDEDNLTETEAEVSGLLQGQSYFWRVRGSGDLGNGPWSPTFRFTTVYAVPGAVTLREPDNGAVDQPVDMTFGWDASTSSPTYQLQVSTNAAFSQLVFEDNNLTDTQHTLALDNGMRYYWRVRGVNPIAQGPWSPTWEVTTMPAQPAAIALSTPANAAQDQPLALDLTWQPDAATTTYRLQVSRTSTFSDIVFNNNALTETTQAIASLDPGTTYYWRVRGSNSVGSGPWSAVFRFTTASTPTAGAPTLPENNTTDAASTLTLMWGEDPTATAYHLQVSETSNFAQRVFEDDALTETTQEIGPLDHGTTYFWRVRGHNAVGDGPWSPVFRFTTAPVPGILALTFPEDNATDAASTIAFAWEADAIATTYHLQVSATSDFSDLAFEDDALTEPTQTFGPLAYSTRHYWRVRATNDVGPGPWSEVRSFTVAVGTSVERAGEAIPTTYQLHANYPNPFNPTTTLRFDLPASSEVTLTIYDMLGREVETLVAGTLGAGSYTFAWEAADRSSGLYLARLHAGRFVQTQRLMLLK